MTIFFVSRLIFVLVLIGMYFKRKNKFDLHLSLIISLYFINDIWRLIRKIHNYPIETIVQVDKCLLIFSFINILILIIFIVKHLKVRPVH
jgi:hypothetical protein